MSIESTEQTHQQVASTTDFRVAYHQGVDDESISPVAKTCAGKIFERLTAPKPNSESAAIMAQMQEAITRADQDEIVMLADQLKALKLEKESQTEKLLSISQAFRFDELLAAYPKEVEALAYELSVLAMSSAQEEIVKSRKRDRSGKPRVASKTYVITHQGRCMDIVPNVGAPSNPGKERALFLFLGFEVSENGKSLTPSTFKSLNGFDVGANSKKAIVDDLLMGGRYWLDKGYTIAEKPASANQDEGEAA